MEENNTTAAEEQEVPTTEEAIEPTAEAPEESSAEAATETTVEELQEPTAEETDEPTAEVPEESSAEAVTETAAEEAQEPAAEEADEPTAEEAQEPAAEAQEEPVVGATETAAEEPSEPTPERDAAAPTAIEELTPKMKLNGTVSRLELYGAFIDIGVGTNALIHISKLGKDHVNRVSDVLNVGDKVAVWVDKVNLEQGQIMVTMIEPLEVEWGDLKKGQTYTGTITRLENYGAFVDVGAEREGLVHISEISHDYVKNPSELLSVGDEVQVQVLDFNRRKRRIDLSIKNLLEKPETESAAVAAYAAFDDADDLEEEIEEVPTAMEVALRKAMGDEPIDSIEGQSRRKRKKGRRRRGRRRDQDDLLDRTLQFEYDA